MNAYLRNSWIRVGLVIVLVGWGPLFAIGLLAAAGLLSDPNPNPVGPGLLFFFSAWPAIICLGIGVLQVRRQRTELGYEEPAEQRVGASTWMEEFFRLPMSRLLVGFVGVVLAAYGLKHLFHPPGSHGGASSLVLAAVAFYWAASARIPSWFRR